GPLTTRTSTKAPSRSGALGTTTPFLTKPATVSDRAWPSGITREDCNRPAGPCRRDARGCLPERPSPPRSRSGPSLRVIGGRLVLVHGAEEAEPVVAGVAHAER